MLHTILRRAKVVTTRDRSGPNWDPTGPDWDPKGPAFFELRRRKIRSRKQLLPTAVASRFLRQHLWLLSMILLATMISQMARKVPELLSPAGDWEAMRSAVANGANACYFGLSHFNARHRATNFRTEELPEIMKYLHDRNVKGFLTFNTLIFSDELDQAVQYIKAIAEAGVDAVIVQDLGLAKLIHAVAPSVHIHGSTQMTLTEPRGIEFVRRFGVERVVVARELSVQDISKIRDATDMELEVFIHGALCVAYSGQCLTSESLGGRSANRGQCAQACRLPYEMVVDGETRDFGDKAYLLSPQDLAAYELVGDLAKLGVASLKIEGRLKGAHYVAATTQTYRAALDAAASSKSFHISPQERADLEQTFSRGFSHGFLDGVNHQKLVTARFPKSRGVKIGTVDEVTRRGLLIELASTNMLKPGDGVVFDEGHPEQDEQGGRVFTVTPRGKRMMEIELGRGDVNLAAISPGAIVWKTDDPQLRKRLEHSFSRDTVVNRIPVDVHVIARVGQTLKIEFQVVEPHARDTGVSPVPGASGMRDHSEASSNAHTPDHWRDARVTGAPIQASVEWDRVLEPSNKYPATVEMLREQLSRLGDSPFELRVLRADIAGGPMIPKSVLNDLRRRAVEQLVAQREARTRAASIDISALQLLREEARSDSLSLRERAGVRADALGGVDLPGIQQAERPYPNPLPKGEGARLFVLVRTLDQLHAVLDYSGELRPSMVYCDFEDVRKYQTAVAAARSAQMPIALAAIRIVKPGEEGFLKQVSDCGPDALLVRNLAGIAFFQEVVPQIPLIGDYSLNIANELTAKIFADAGLIRIVPSYDLNWKQLAAMIARSMPQMFEAVIHQHMPMFHMEHCAFAHMLSTGKDFRDCGRPCEAHQVNLRDRVGQEHPLIPDVGCRNTVYNAQAQTALEFVPRMRQMGISNFRVEMLRESANQVAPLIDRYARVLTGKEDPKAMRSLRVVSQLGVTRGTLDHE